jgi:hypothetical protein
MRSWTKVNRELDSLEQEAGISNADSAVASNEQGMVFVELALPFGHGAAHAVVWGNSSDVAELSRDY